MATPGGNQGGSKGPGGGNKGSGKAPNPNKGGGGKGGISPAFKAYLTGQSLLTTPKMTLGAARALTNLQIQGPYTALSRQIAQNNRQSTAAQKLSGGYFTQFGQQAQQGVTDAAKIASDLQTQLQGINTSTQSQLADQGQQAQQSIQAYTPGSPAMSSPAMQSVAAEIARQAGLATQQGQNALTSGALQSGNYSNLAASQLGTGALAATEQLGQIAQAGRLANQPLTTQQATLLGERGPLMTTNVNKIVQQGITNAITEQGLSNTKLGILTSAATAAAARRAAAQQDKANRQFTAGQNALDRAARLAQENQIQTGENARSAAAIAARKAAADATARAKKVATGTGGAKPLPQSEQNSLFNQLDAAVKHIPMLFAGGIKDSKGTVITPRPTQQQIANLLVTSGYPQVIVDAAFELLHRGTITPATARDLRAHGLRGGFYQGAPIRVRRPSGSLAGGAAAGAAGSATAGAGQAGGGAAGGIGSVAG